MSREPYFSIVIPSKNRPERLREATRSVLGQTFGDLEVVVCDNSDPAEAALTRAVVDEIDDPRVRYVRTSGTLSMPDNWEHGVASAMGRYVGVLTDRSVFYPFALERAHREIAATGVSLIGWFGDSYGRGSSGRDFRRRPRTGRSWIVGSRRILEYFVHGHPKLAGKRLPKLMTGVCARSVIDEIRASRLGRICPPVAPDYTSGYLMLAHTSEMVLIDDAHFVSVGSGNGSSFRRRGELANRFLQDLGMTWYDLVDRMPTRAGFTTGLVLNDLMRVKDALPERFVGLDVNPVQYYLGCLADYERVARRGAELFEDYDELMRGLLQEPAAVQAAVRRTNVYVRAASLLPPDTDGPIAAADDEGAEDLAAPEFPTVFEAMDSLRRESPPRDRGPATHEMPLPMPSLTDVSPATFQRKRRPLFYDEVVPTEYR